MEDRLLEEAVRIQRGAMEEDDRQGMVEEYLNTLLPMNWPEMDLMDRRNFLIGKNDPSRPKGVLRRETVSNVEIWVECFGKDPAIMKKQDSVDISAIMVRVEGWERSTKRGYLPFYGRQRICVRTEEKNNPDPPDPEDGILSLCPETETVSPNPVSDAEESCQVQFSEEDVASRIQAPEPLYDFLR